MAEGSSVQTRSLLLAILPAVLATARAGSAQEVPAGGAERDSLAVELRALRAKVDSLALLLDSLLALPTDSAAPADELAALRAAAREAAGEDARPADTAAASPAGTGLNRLNPEISVTGDVRLRVTRPGPQSENVDVREFEFGFQSDLDPFARTKIFLSFEEGELDLEEAYAYWTALPGGLRVDLGRLRQQLGELNRVHLHALPESEYPRVYRAFLGEEGLVANGLRLYWLAPFHGPGGATHELWGEVTLGDNETLFADGDRLSVLGHLNNFWQLDRASFLQLGGSVVYGENPDEQVETLLAGADARFTWQPPGRELYRSFTLRAEAYALHREVLGADRTRFGAYAGAEYRLSRRLLAGARLDWVELPDDPRGRPEWAIVPSITWWQSEWVRLRAEWQHVSTPLGADERESSDRWLIQAVWSVGPHKHESY